MASYDEAVFYHIYPLGLCGCLYIDFHRSSIL